MNESVSHPIPYFISGSECAETKNNLSALDIQKTKFVEVVFM